jgi:hypothetical protein
VGWGKPAHILSKQCHARAVADRLRDATFKSIANDNEMSDLRPTKALEVMVAKTRKDLARFDKMLRLIAS